MSQTDNNKLQLYLRKCELQWRADHSDGLDSVDWLAPYCNSVEGIAAYLRELGFKIRHIVDREKSWGEGEWVITTSGLIVYVNDEYCHGSFGKEYRG